jgi:hypothetical protein
MITRGQLFSEYFLTEGIRNSQEYLSLSSETLDATLQEMKACYDLFARRQHPNEADTEDGIIRPVLKALGFSFSRQQPASHGGLDVPDFILFSSNVEKDAFDRAGRHENKWRYPVSILEAKRWERSLDRGDKTSPADPHIPSNQILRYLSVCDSESNGKMLWGVLTNGKTWRLYYHRSLTRSEGYIEFDLGEVLSDAHESFRIFYLLFRKEAFVETPLHPGFTFLEYALQEGKQWEERVAENLKKNIFGEVFLLLAQGFMKCAEEKGEEKNDGLVRRIYDNTLVLLYRLLFLFYAEDRDLLPTRQARYSEYSLNSLRDHIHDILDRSEPLSAVATTCWDRVKNLFRIVDRGDKALSVPPYNGGLFKPHTYPFLEEFSISDEYFARALHLLSHSHHDDEPKRINYRDLTVRQLGSIYEGLLEFRLKIAETNLKIKKEKSKEIYVPAENVSQADVLMGDPYLTNDRSERRATGSYYTPDYIVQFIVSNTIEPLIKERIAAFEAWKGSVSKMSKQEIQREFVRHNVLFDPKTYDSEGRIIEDKGINAFRTALLALKDPVESLLSIKILDPAMGSGHFLVTAVDYLADRSLEILAGYSGKAHFGAEIYESPVIGTIEKVRNTILRQVDKHHFVIDESKLDDKNLIKRIVLKRCIYGVDRNPLAVELAKVSLWLHTFTVGAPLSFLDHHLKYGNSLAGEWEISDVVIQGSKRYQDFLVAVKNMLSIQDLYDLTINETAESARHYDLFKEKLTVFVRQCAINMAAEHFMDNELKGLEKAARETVRNSMKRKALDETFTIPFGQGEMLYSRAIEIAEEKRFFHWKLEFPEIWYAEDGRQIEGGFDAVIGNPPYIRIQELRKEHPDEVDYYNNTYRTPTGAYDIYTLFVEKGISLLHDTGCLGYILPNKFTKLDSGKGLRRLIGSRMRLLIDFGDNQIFAGQTTYTGLLFLDGRPREKGQYRKIPTLGGGSDGIAKLLTDTSFPTIVTENAKLTEEPWAFADEAATRIRDKMDAVSVPLGSVVEQIFQGLITSADPVYILTLRERAGEYTKAYSKASGKEIMLETALLKPLVSGEDVSRYGAVLTDKLLLFPYRLSPGGGATLIEEDEFTSIYPKTWAHLKEHEGLLRGRERGLFDDDAWYRFGRTQNLDKHERPKLGVARLTERLAFIYDGKGEFYFDNVDVNGLLLKTDSPYSGWYLMAVLNSTLIDRHFKEESVPFRGNFYSANKQFISPLPIRKIDFSAPDERALDSLMTHVRKGAFLAAGREAKMLPADSPVLHDLLAALAMSIARKKQTISLLTLFCDGALETGSHEKIEMLRVLRDEVGTLPDDPVIQKEMAIRIISQENASVKETDALIDSIVYHLYGLTPEEIAIVED